MSFWSKLRSEWDDFRKQEEEKPDRVMGFLNKVQSQLEETRQDLFKNEDFRCENFHAAEAKRNYLIFFDGTGNDPTADEDHDLATASTNVYRLFKMIDQGRSQLARYYPGVGSGQDDPNPVSALFRQFSGKGANRIMNTAYRQLIEDYHPGDRIFVSGFSRGAAIARMLANKIFEEGIRESGTARYVDLEHSDDLILDSVELSGAKQEVPVEVLGVWDTVAAFGLPTNQYEPFKNLTVAGNVRKAYHLLSIDENRKYFLPTLMNAEGRIEEIWFPGVHADVGGGYRDRDLADITLQFMGNRFAEHEVTLKPPEHVISPDPAGMIHAHDESRLPKREREITVEGPSRKVRIHQSAIQRRDAVATYRPPELDRLIESGDFLLDDRT